MPHSSPGWRGRAVVVAVVVLPTLAVAGFWLAVGLPTSPGPSQTEAPTSRSPAAPPNGASPASGTQNATEHQPSRQPPPNASPNGRAPVGNGHRTTPNHKAQAPTGRRTASATPPEDRSHDTEASPNTPNEPGTQDDHDSHDRRQTQPWALAGDSASKAASPTGPDQNGQVTKVGRAALDGTVRFLTLTPGAHPSPTPLGVAPTAPPPDVVADTALTTHGHWFGVASPTTQLQLSEVRGHPAGVTSLHYQQTRQGIPVFGGELRVHLGPHGQAHAINGRFFPPASQASGTAEQAAATAEQAAATAEQAAATAEQAAATAEQAAGASPAASDTPTAQLSPDQAATKALAWITTHQQRPPDASAPPDASHPSHPPITATTQPPPELTYYQRHFLQGISSGRQHLTYRVEVTNHHNVREFVFVDAHHGKVIAQHTGLAHAKDRVVYDGPAGGYSSAQPSANIAQQEGGAASANSEVRAIFDVTGDTYDLFFNAFGRDSYDGAGRTMRSVWSPTNLGCPNATWNGVTTNFCTGVTGDDTVAHEWAHAYTEYTHNLIYQWQSGALNEAYSDIFGEAVDLLNGTGTDSPNTLRSAGTCTLQGTDVRSVTVNSPAQLAGSLNAGRALFGPSLQDTGAITGNVVLAQDGTSPSGDGCETLTNGSDISGNIAIIDRGTCFFVTKVQNAQAAGAIGVIVVNHAGDGIVTMSGDDSANPVTIPSLFLGQSDGTAVKNALPGVNVTLEIPAASENSVRWLHGEDDTTLGIIRDMWEPTCFGHPGKVSDGTYRCGSGDAGGVHSNSGVPNHAYALLVDGGTYNGVTVPAIGLTKATHIYFRAMDQYQLPTSEFSDHADALDAACTDLLTAGELTSLSDGSASGAFVTTADCTAVDLAMQAVEMRGTPGCNFAPLLAANPPSLCVDSDMETVIYTDDFETDPLHRADPADNWSIATTGVFAEYTTQNWQWRSSLPDGQSGSAFYAFNSPVLGDCIAGSDDQSGVVELTSPNITMPAGDADVVLSFDHWVATEASYDGGNLRVSVNGGAFALVSSADFSFNAYNATLVGGGGNTNPLAGEAAFSGTDAGSLSGSWGESRVLLNRLAGAGDTVAVQFRFGVDGCNGVTGWFVDNVKVRRCLCTTDADCDDGNACTTNTCQAQTGCVTSHNTNPCDDGDACTTQDLCASGVCHGGAALSCDDSDPCTTDACSMATGCVHTDTCVELVEVSSCQGQNDGVRCDDSDPCTIEDQCQSGICVGSGKSCAHLDSTCQVGICDVISGECGAVAAANGSTCSDSDSCTSDDRCNDGTCVGSPVAGCEGGGSTLSGQNAGTLGGSGGATGGSGSSSTTFSGGGCQSIVGGTPKSTGGTTQAWLYLAAALTALCRARRRRLTAAQSR